MEESNIKVTIKTEGNSALGLQDLYKAACNGNYDTEAEPDKSYPAMTIKPLSYLAQDCFIDSNQISSNRVFETTDSVLNLDKGLPVQINNKDISSFNGDSDLLQRFLLENSLTKQNPSTSYITIVDMNAPVKLESNHFIDDKNNVISTGPNSLSIDNCDFNSSDSFASTESIIPKNIKCPKCPKKFMFKSDLLRHDKHRHKKKMLSCSFCHKEFSCKEKLAFHETSRTCPEVTCRLCNKAFQKPVNLSKHIYQSHKTIVIHKCPKCDTTFPIPENLKEHVSKCHPEVVDYYPCEFCHKIFLVKRSLQVHLKKHFVRICHVCNESFNDNSGLAEHMKTHTDDTSPAKEENIKPFKCEHCPKTYVNRYSYKHHLLKHAEPKVCKICNEKFENVDDLQAHIRLHTFECNICSRKFTTQPSLNRHFKRKHNNNLMEQEAFTQTEDEIFQLQNVNIVVDPSSGGSESFLLATPINSLGPLPIFISQQLNVPFSVPTGES